jgi:hypothetical protein
MPVHEKLQINLKQRKNMKKHKKNKQPRVSKSIMMAVDFQLLSNDLPEVRETYDRLYSQGYSDEDARKLIGAALATENFMIFKHKKSFNKARYIANLRNLPTLPAQIRKADVKSADPSLSWSERV